MFSVFGLVNNLGMSKKTIPKILVGIMSIRL